MKRNFIRLLFVQRVYQYMSIKSHNLNLNALAHDQLQDFSGYFGAIGASPHRTGISDPQTHNLRASHDGGSVGVV